MFLNLRKGTKQKIKYLDQRPGKHVVALAGYDSMPWNAEVSK